MNKPVSQNASSNDANPTPSSKPPRNPVERLIVWGGIAIISGITLMEAHAKTGHSWTITRLKKEFSDENDRYASWSRVQTFISGYPTHKPVSTGSTTRKNVLLTWPSLFKTYQIELVMENEGTDPLVLGFTTPGSVDELELAGFPAPTDPSSGGNVSQEQMELITPSLPPGFTPMGASGGGGGRPGGGGRGAGGGSRRLSLLSLALRPTVTTELKLTEEQSKKLAEVQENAQSAFMGLQSVPEEQRPQAMRELRDKQEATLREVVDEAQFTRLRQLYWRENGLASLERDDVATLLGLGSEERDKLKPVLDERQQELRGMRQASPQEISDKRAEWDTKLRELLTEDQRAKWKEALGAPLATEGSTSQ